MTSRTPALAAALLLAAGLAGAAPAVEPEPAPEPSLPSAVPDRATPTPAALPPAPAPQPAGGPLPVDPQAERAAAPLPGPGDYGQRADVAATLDQLAERHRLDPAALRSTLAQARYLPRAVQLILPPPAGTAKNWAAYRARFVEPRRIRAGTAFWQQHAGLLQQVEDATGVPAAIVVGILGVETLWGEDSGSFRVLDSLATLAFDFPSGARRDRSGFFRDELGAFLAWCAREGLDPASVRGSYAGAIGLPQFMPSSIFRFAVDQDGDGHIDLRGSAADAIGSVAAYLDAHGWQRGLPTHFTVTPPTDPQALATLLAPDIVPSFRAAEMDALGARLPPAARQGSGLLALVALENGDAAPTRIAGTSNFYAITRYNQSSYYALAVIELGEAVAAARRGTAPARRARKPAAAPAASRAAPARAAERTAPAAARPSASAGAGSPPR